VHAATDEEAHAARLQGVPALERHSGARRQGLQAARALEGGRHLREGFLNRRLHLGVHRGAQPHNLGILASKFSR